MAQQAVKAVPPEAKLDAMPAADAAGEAPAPSAVVLPRRQSIGPDVEMRPDVRELQAMIERSFSLQHDDDGDAAADPAAMPGTGVVLGPAPGSELKYQPTFIGRFFKTFAGTAVIVMVGLVPLQRATTPVSSAAYVDAPVYALRAPADGVFSTGQLIVGARVARGVPLAMVANPTDSSQDAAVVSGGGGKVWDVLFQSGDLVSKGDVIARVVGCSAAHVTAGVSEFVYDQLRPGTPARFNFFGSTRFYEGQVANLLGHGGDADGAAISSAAVPADDFRVVISMPTLGVIDDCAVGRRGAVVFSPKAG